LEDEDERSERLIARRKRSLTPIFVALFVILSRFFSSGSPVSRDPARVLCIVRTIVFCTRRRLSGQKNRMDQWINW
jgi:hypothetical protein